MEESNVQMSGSFSIRVKIGNAEIEVSAPDKEFVLEESDRLLDQFNLAAVTMPVADLGAYPNGANSAVDTTGIQGQKQQTLSEFVQQFTGLQTNLDKMLVLGYWWEIEQEKKHFTVANIESMYDEIKENHPSYIKRDLERIQKKGFLMPPKKYGDEVGYELSSSGIKEVKSKMASPSPK